jgi:hypothetical protein
MSRNNGTLEARPPSAVEAVPPPPRTIDDNALHPVSEWTRILNLPANCLKREARLGRLRVSKRAGKLWCLGAWIKEWVASGEVRRHSANGRTQEGASSPRCPVEV